MTASVHQFPGNTRRVIAINEQACAVEILPVIRIERKPHKLPRKLRQQMTKLELLKRLNAEMRR